MEEEKKADSEEVQQLKEALARIQAEKQLLEKGTYRYQVLSLMAMQIEALNGIKENLKGIGLQLEKKA